MGRFEYGCYAGIGLSLAGLWWVVLSGNSGLGGPSPTTSLGSLALISLSGASITVSLLFSKRLHDHGLDSAALTSVRFVLAMMVAGCVQAIRGDGPGMGRPTELLTLSLAATTLIVLPTFAMQAGLVRTATLTAHVIRALGPVCVFVFEQVDRRMDYSAPTLLCIITYSACAIAGNIARG